MCDRSHISDTTRLAVQLSMAVFASTLHAQDFKDVSGDCLTGRCTLPILFPVCARLSIALGIPLWAICLSRVWRLDLLSATTFVLYSGYTGFRFLRYRSVDDDKRSCKFYSVSAMSHFSCKSVCLTPLAKKFWLSIHQALPAYLHLSMVVGNLWSVTLSSRLPRS